MDNAAYICDRLQKITEALYRVTDLLSEKEPLKWEIREKAVSIFSKIISIQNFNAVEKISVLSESENLLGQMAALLSLFLNNKTVATINFEILKEEYEAIQKIISKEKEAPPADFIKLDFTGLKEPQTIGQISNGQSIGQAIINEMSDRENFKHEQDQIKPNPKNWQKNTQRKEKILGILKDKKEVTIGDLLVFFPEYSEKTLQRDLLAMTDKGLLKKQGDKRWRRYSIPEY